MQVTRVRPPDLGATAATVVGEAIEDALDRRGLAAVALSGGSTPGSMLTALVGLDLPWHRIHVFQVDERIATPGDPARNLTGLRELLLDHVPAIAHPMPVEDDDLTAAAERYAATLVEHAAGSLDLVHLGLGADGHTASLFPGDPAVDVRDRDVAVTSTARSGYRRMTLTLPVLERAWNRLWLISGGDKRAALDDLLHGDGPATTPASLIPRDHSRVVTDLA